MPINYPQWLYKTTWIYHITHIDNIEGIINSKYIYAKNHLTANHCSIANAEIQQKRDQINITIEPNGTLHDYVPFSFAPRQPMLYVNYRGGIDNACKQEDIVHFVSNAELVSNTGLKFVLTNKHPLVSVGVKFYNQISDLSQIDWDLFFETPLTEEYSVHWRSVESIQHPKWIKRAEIRQAEFLIYKQFPWSLVLKVGTIDKVRADKIQSIFNKYEITTNVEIKKGWYY